MPLIDLPRDQLGVGLCRGTENEEGGSHLQSRQHIEHERSPARIGAIVEGQGQLARLPSGLENHPCVERLAGARGARGGP